MSGEGLRWAARVYDGRQGHARDKQGPKHVERRVLGSSYVFFLSFHFIFITNYIFRYCMTYNNDDDGQQRQRSQLHHVEGLRGTDEASARPKTRQTMCFGLFICFFISFHFIFITNYIFRYRMTSANDDDGQQSLRGQPHHAEG
jgi:hypothetical protein